jgi:TnpA family transposase
MIEPNLLNSLALWNTRYMDLALNHLRSQGAKVCMDGP